QRLHEHFVWPEKIPKEEQERVFKKVLIREARLEDLLRRPDVSYHDLMSLAASNNPQVSPVVAEQVEIQAKYSGYIERQREEIEKLQRHNDKVIPDYFDYSAITSLSAEVKEKFIKIKPKTVGHAARIQGVTPAAISLLLVFLKKQKGPSGVSTPPEGIKEA
ncbi:MAG: tRNA uridine-5-carboxymethylaminomethyl(34) synthesis enzyme MnmG, partial [Gammaproteobacteria bacterium]|nr:tRNA uridine-5-carboxymethylaminomethyl(34) synthesis enzyme MnmG [Gammaproteobacteria bacterium]